jgi:hypothetical protein
MKQETEKLHLTEQISSLLKKDEKGKESEGNAGAFNT